MVEITLKNIAYAYINCLITTVLLNKNYENGIIENVIDRFH